MVHIINILKNVKVFIKNRCKVAYANVSNPQISCARIASVLEYSLYSFLIVV